MRSSASTGATFLNCRKKICVCNAHFSLTVLFLFNNIYDSLLFLEVVTLYMYLNLLREKNNLRKFVHSVCKHELYVSVHTFLEV